VQLQSSQNAACGASQLEDRQCTMRPKKPIQSCSCAAERQESQAVVMKDWDPHPCKVSIKH